MKIPTKLSTRLDTRPRADEQVSIKDSYLAMIRMLNYYAQMEGDIAEMLLDLGGLEDMGSEMDPIAWDLWLDCLDDREPLGSGGSA